MKKINIYSKTLAGNMGEGWTDEIEANKAYAQFLADRIQANVKLMFPEFSVESEVFPETASGGNGRSEVVVDCDDEDEAIRVMTRVEDEIDYILRAAWDAWCDSDEAKKYWSED